MASVNSSSINVGNSGMTSMPHSMIMMLSDVSVSPRTTLASAFISYLPRGTSVVFHVKFRVRVSREAISVTFFVSMKFSS